MKENYSKQENSRFIVIDTETGETVNDAIVYTKGQIQAIEKYNERGEMIGNIKKNKTENRFIWYMFDNNNRNIVNLTPRTAARLIYAATYLEYDGRFLKDERENLDQIRLRSLMSLGNETFMRFAKEAAERNYLIKNHNEYELKSDCFKKGQIKDLKALVEKRAVRLYITPIRKLYQSTPKSKHVYLGYIFQLIPYFNREYNILCHNPLEKVRENIVHMTTSDFCDLIGYDSGNASRLMKEYGNITFEWQGRKQVFFGKFQTPGKSEPGLYVNPLVLFGGNDFNKQKIMEEIFM